MKEKDQANCECFDCGVSDPKWVCVLNGVFLCLTCAGTHRSMGVMNSKVQSTVLDGWTPTQMETMEIGGNSRAREYMTKYDLLEKSIIVKERFTCKAMMYYRKML